MPATFPPCKATSIQLESTNKDDCKNDEIITQYCTHTKRKEAANNTPVSFLLHGLAPSKYVCNSAAARNWKERIGLRGRRTFIDYNLE